MENAENKDDWAEQMEIVRERGMVNAYRVIKEKEEKLKKQQQELENQQIKEYKILINEQSKRESKRFYNELERKRNSWPLLTKLLHSHNNAKVRESIQRQRRRAKRAKNGSTNKKDIEAMERENEIEKQKNQANKVDKEKHKNIEIMRQNMTKKELEKEKIFFEEVKLSSRKQMLNEYSDLMETIIKRGQYEGNATSHQSCSNNASESCSKIIEDDISTWPMHSFDSMKKSEIKNFIKLYFPDVCKEDGGVLGNECDGESEDSDGEN